MLGYNVIYYTELKKNLSQWMYFTITWAARRLNPYLYPYPFCIYSKKLALWTPTTSAKGIFIVFRNTVVPVHMADCKYWSISVLECSFPGKVGKCTGDESLESLHVFIMLLSPGRTTWSSSKAQRSCCARLCLGGRCELCEVTRAQSWRYFFTLYVILSR